MSINVPTSATDIKLFVGVYKHGIADVCFLELAAANAQILYHNLAHQLMLFRLPVPRESGNVDDHCFREELPLSFDVLFEPICSYGTNCRASFPQNNGASADEDLQTLLHRTFPRSPHVEPVIETRMVGRNKTIPLKKCRQDPQSRQNALEVMSKVVEENLEKWCRAIDRPWRVSCEKVGAHGVNSPELCRDFGSICTEKFGNVSDELRQKFPVSMEEYELEIVLLLSHAGSRETADGKKLSEQEALLVVPGGSSEFGPFGAVNVVNGGDAEASSMATSMAAMSMPSSSPALVTDVGDLAQDLWCFGIRLRRPSLLERRGVEVMKTNFSVAASLSLLVLRELINNSPSRKSFPLPVVPTTQQQASTSTTIVMLDPLTILDPMCGHGTLPLVMHIMQQKVQGAPILAWHEKSTKDGGGDSEATKDALKRRRTGADSSSSCSGREDGTSTVLVGGQNDPLKSTEQDHDDTTDHDVAGGKLIKNNDKTCFTVLGADAKDSSYAQSISRHFRDQVLLRSTTLQPPCASWLGAADTRRLQLRSSTIDAVVVDPPWGQRHGSHTFVAKNLRKWLLEWSRVLRVGGLMGIVTIRTKHTIHELELEPFKTSLRPVEGFPRVFNNCGYPQCMFFLLRKVA